MEQEKDVLTLLELSASGAFCVKESLVTQVNSAARLRGIETGMQISDLFATGAREYADFTDGCLYLTLCVSGVTCDVSVSRLDGFDLFRMEPNSVGNELQTLALAAKSLRKPLSALLNSVDELFPALSANSGEAERNEMASVNRSLYQILRLVSNMSDASRYAHSGAECEVRDVSAILDEIVSHAADLLADAGITLKFEKTKGSVYTLVHSELLERAVFNLLSNAAKFTPKGGTIQISLTRYGGMLRLCIQGGGEDNRVALSGIFSRYLREPSVEDGRFGLGLGLTIVRLAAAKHGGTVLVEQPQGEGMKVSLTLAIRRIGDAPLRSPVFRFDYAGERDHARIELSDILPADAYCVEDVN